MKAVPLSRYLIFLAIAGVGLVADLTTKKYVFDWLGPHGDRTYWLWKDVFGFQTNLNPGALFGIGADWPPMRYVTSALSILAAIAIVVWLFAARAARDLVLTIALGCVSAGILGNLYDRLGLAGLSEGGQPIYKVRDWILMLIFGYHWPNYNIADSLLVCGAGLVIWRAFVADSVGEPAQTAEPSAQQEARNQ
jgi:signal peptidase II